MKSVTTHLWVCVDDEGRPRKAFHTKDEAMDAVADDTLSNEHLVDCYPDVPLMEAEE